MLTAPLIRTRMSARISSRFVARGIALPLIAAATIGAAPQSYTLDSKASSITTKVPFLGIGSRSATFNTITGTVRFVPERPKDARLNVTIHTQDIKAPDAVTLKRLKGEKFFWVDKYPKARFVGSGLVMTDARNGRISGKLTARGITRAETLYVTFDKNPKAAMGKPITLRGRMTINRKNYGMNSYNLVVGKNVKISLKARMVPG
jgi:polyisoprenoid-binding protein YceI